MSDTKRQDLPTGASRGAPGLPGGLWVVATPIGNLSDLSPRARHALECADAVLCEDTRRTQRLMAALGIPARLERFDAHSGAGQVARLVERLSAGRNLALVTDAGTPGISDPGAELVAAAREAGVLVTPVPGPAAVTALLSVAGFTETAFAFMGFFPRKKGDRERVLGLARSSPLARLFVWYESPERVVEALATVAETLPEAQVVAAKELSKAHERVFAGDAPAVASLVRREIEAQGALGEWCFALRLSEMESRESESSDWIKALQCLINARVSASEAAREVSQIFGVNKKGVYEMALKFSGKK